MKWEKFDKPVSWEKEGQIEIGAMKKNRDKLYVMKIKKIVKEPYCKEK